MTAIAAAAAALLLAAPPTIDVRVMTKNHPHRLTLDGPRHVVIAVIGGTLRVDGATVRAPFELPPATWNVRSAGAVPRSYAGSLLVGVSGGELAVVVRMDREVYVALAVAGETPPGAPRAALEAQAIVARSWAIAARRRHADADVCDLAHCQVLRARLPDAHLAAARRAALATRGRVLVLASGATAMTPFHPACGGRTADPREVFGGGNRTGAESVDDPGCAGPYWRAVLPRDLVERAAAAALGARGGSALDGSPPRFASLALIPGDGGWLHAVADETSGRVGFADALTRALGRLAGWGVIRGGRFRWSLGPSGSVVIEGSGLGHGVGLCQAGAARRARAGETALDILTHYFPDATPGVAPAEPLSRR